MLPLMMGTRRRADPDLEPTLLTAADVAVMLNLHVSTVWPHERDGLIPPAVRLGHRTFWRRTDLVLFVEQAGCDMAVWRRLKRERGA